MAERVLYVVTPIFNPWRYESRKKLYEQFRRYVHCSHTCRLYVGELAFGDRDFEVTSGHRVSPDGGETHEFRYRTRCELWHKERMLNRLIQELPSDWEYVAWVDADLQFVRTDWAKETVERLQHYDIVQMFSHAQNLAPDYSVLRRAQPRLGFVHAYLNNLQPGAAGQYGAFQWGHPGFAWAMRRDMYEKLGGLLDISILGSGDFHMALAMIEKLEDQLPEGSSAGYREQLVLWADRCRKYLRQNIGYVPGLVNHYWHGSRKDRRYNERWNILVENQYDPEFDLKLDAQGLWQWTDRCPRLQHQIREYFSQRHEDSIDPQ